MSDLETITCATCGVDFALPEHLANQHRRKHDTFYCPNGHNNYFPGKTREERRIAELEQQLLDEKRERSMQFRELLARKYELEELAISCPLCNEHVGRRNYRDETNTAKLGEHLTSEHGARLSRLRAIPRVASEGNA